jgi:membrane dipeptidase
MDTLWSRRRFLAAAGRAAAGLTLTTGLAPGLLSGCAAPRRFLPPPPGGGRVLADLHVHMGMQAWLATTPVGLASPALLGTTNREFNPTATTWAELHGAGVDLVCVAHFNVFDEWVSMPTDPSAQAPVHTHRMLDLLEETLRGPAAPYATLAPTPDALEALLDRRMEDDDHRVAVVHSLEGGHALGGDPARVEEFARRGVAYVTLTHFFHKGLSSAPNSFPFFPDANAAWSPLGLTGKGREMVAELQRCGVIVDATHLTDHAVADLLACTRRPLLASHASARALGDHPYSFHDEHLQGIVEGGGLIGVILYPFVLGNYGDMESARRHGSIEDTVRTVGHVLKVTGRADAVALGSDFGGYIQGPKEMRSVGQIDLVRRRLIEEFGREQAEAVLFGNAADFLRRNWGVGA